MNAEDKKGDPASLSPLQKTRFATWFAKKTEGKDASCSFCGVEDWLLSDHFVSPMIANAKGETLPLHSKAYPNFLVSCKNCGNTHFFNAVLVGAFPPSEKSE